MKSELKFQDLEPVLATKRMIEAARQLTLSDRLPQRLPGTILYVMKADNALGFEVRQLPNPVSMPWPPPHLTK